MKPADRARFALQAKTQEPEEPKEQDFLSTGLTLLNLATYGNPFGGLLKGHVYRVAGSSGDGKTFLCNTIMAEAANNPNFDGYDLIYDDIERGSLIDTMRFFGAKLSERLDIRHSRSINDFYSSLQKKLDTGQPFIWVADSMDCLNPEAETKMTDGKAKINSQELRKVIDPLYESKSMLILVSQAKVDMRSMYGGLTTSGGNALLYYSTLDIWLKRVKTLVATYKEKKYPVGSLISAKIKKNRLSGVDRNVLFPFSPDYGIDDIGSCVDFLTSGNHWKKTKAGIDAREFGFQGTRKELIAWIEKENNIRPLRLLVAKVWREIEKACTTTRVPRYS